MWKRRWQEKRLCKNYMKNCPTLGITAIEQSDWPPFGKQRFFFEDMVKAASDLGLNFFFFSPFDIYKYEIEGWVFEKGNWQRQKQNRPDFIYDRAFSALETERIELANFRQFLKGESLKVLNPVGMALLCDDKAAFHHFLQKHKIPTLEVLPFESLCSESIFIKRHSYYVKPLSGSGGIGIFVVYKTNKGFVLNNHLNDESMHFESLSELNDYLTENINPAQYFIQPKAKIFDFENAPIDLRVLIQNHGGSSYQISGMALRQGQAGSNVSNLQSGGTALAFEEIAEWLEEVLHFSTSSMLEQVKNISFDTCLTINQEFGEFAEIGLDFLLTTEGPIVMEGNARPSRWVFNVLADRYEADPEKSLFYKSQRALSVKVPAVFAKNLEKV
jgi:glutathione synthase/RimK-type ligase-like ATP-grasp enzyme